MKRRKFLHTGSALWAGLLLPATGLLEWRFTKDTAMGGDGVEGIEVGVGGIPEDGSRVSEAVAGGVLKEVILFDAFAVFDPRGVFEQAMRLFPEKGADLVREWKIRQFEYTWLRNITGRYEDFILVIEDALRYAARLVGLSLSREQTGQLVEAYYQLPVWPDVPEALSRLKSAGHRLGFLSNFTSRMLQVNSDRNGIVHYFEHLLSVDAIRSYKPDPAAYQLGMTAFGVAKNDVMFIPFAGWDAAGAKSFGYTTFWVNRLGMPEEELGVSVDKQGKTLDRLPAVATPT